MREIIRMLLSDGVFFLQDFPISRVGRFLFRIGLFREYYSIGGRFLKFFSAFFSFFFWESGPFRRDWKMVRTFARSDSDLLRNRPEVSRTERERRAWKSGKEYDKNLSYAGIGTTLHEKSSVLQDCPGERVRTPIDRFPVLEHNISEKIPGFVSRRKICDSFPGNTEK